MASRNAEEQRPHKHPWRKSTQRLSCRLFCCSCLQAEEKDPLQEQEREINGAPRHLHLDQRESGRKDAIQITVEDLGIVNASFSLFDDDPMTRRNNTARSASSVSACPRALKKKRLKAVSSLPIQPQVKPAIYCTSGEDDEEEEEGSLLFASGINSTKASGSLLTQPVINLIPPTPSDIADDDQFFDINSEKSGAHASGSDGGFAVGEQESYEEKMESVEPTEEYTHAENRVMADGAAEPEEGLSNQFEGEKEALPTKSGDKEQTKPTFTRSAYQVPPLPEYPRKRSFNTGINLLSFTEHNLDDLSNRDVSCSDVLKADLCLPSHATNMDTFPNQPRLITRSCSLGDRLTRSATFHALTCTSESQEEESSPQQPCITVAASSTPQSKDQNGNFPEKDVNRQGAKPLGKLNTDEVCQWFTRIGLQKCLPFIREAKLCGADIASVDVNTLDSLHIFTLEDKEQLLSAIYNELHPPTTVSQKIDSLLESVSHNVETFTSALVSMSKSTSSPHVSCLSMNRRSLKLRNNSQNYMVPKNPQLIEITINVSERIVHLRTPKETTAGKIMDSCIKMLGMTEDRSLFILKDTQGSSEGLPTDQQIGSLLTSMSENGQLELHLCKTEKLSGAAAQNNPDVNSSDENSTINSNVQPAKEERIRELNQQVDSLQNVIFQVQELHHSLVAFCSELKSMDGDVNVDRVDTAELKQRLESVKSQLNAKKLSLQALRDNTNNPSTHKKQFDVRLLEKMKLNCQVFKEEISMVHLNRQVAHIQNALQERYVKEKARRKSLAISSLSQLLSLQSPAMLMAVQEKKDSDGHYGFSCCYKEGSGLVVVKVDDSQLCVDDRLMEVNGVPVVNSTQEELTDILLQGSSAQIVVLRQPPPTLTSQQHMVNPDPMQTISPGGDVVTVETPPQRRVMAI